jgi:aspartyl-tRNA(Asn)/glutamyl-tRNA(Gln) amidotransferase subunit B
VVAERGLAQVNDSDEIRAGIAAVIAANSQQVAQYLSGKDTMAKWFFGQAMRALGGQANPALVQRVLDEELQRVRADAQAGT